MEKDTIFYYAGECVKYTSIILLFLAIGAIKTNANDLKNACKQATFGTTRPTKCDKELEKKLSSLQKTDPEKYNQLMLVAKKKPSTRPVKK